MLITHVAQLARRIGFHGLTPFALLSSSGENAGFLYTTVCRYSLSRSIIVKEWLQIVCLGSQGPFLLENGYTTLFIATLNFTFPPSSLCEQEKHLGNYYQSQMWIQYFNAESRIFPCLSWTGYLKRTFLTSASRNAALCSASVLIRRMKWNCISENSAFQ